MALPVMTISDIEGNIAPSVNVGILVAPPISDAPISQVIYLLQGWSIISSYIDTTQLINWDDDYQTTVDIKAGTSLSSTYTPYFLSSFNDTPLQDWGTSGGIVEQNLSSLKYTRFLTSKKSLDSICCIKFNKSLSEL